MSDVLVVFGFQCPADALYSLGLTTSDLRYYDGIEEAVGEFCSDHGVQYVIFGQHADIEPQLWFVVDNPTRDLSEGGGIVLAVDPAQNDDPRLRSAAAELGIQPNFTIVAGLVTY